MPADDMASFRLGEIARTYAPPPEARRGGHWKHEWIPLDAEALKEKHHGHAPPGAKVGTPGGKTVWVAASSHRARGKLKQITGGTPEHGIWPDKGGMPTGSYFEIPAEHAAKVSNVAGLRVLGGKPKGGRVFKRPTFSTKDSPETGNWPVPAGGKAAPRRIPPGPGPITPDYGARPIGPEPRKQPRPTGGADTVKLYDPMTDETLEVPKPAPPKSWGQLRQVDASSLKPGDTYWNAGMGEALSIGKDGRPSPLVGPGGPDTRGGTTWRVTQVTSDGQMTAVSDKGKIRSGAPPAGQKVLKVSGTGAPPKGGAARIEAAAKAGTSYRQRNPEPKKLPSPAAREQATWGKGFEATLAGVKAKGGWSHANDIEAMAAAAQALQRKHPGLSPKMVWQGAMKKRMTSKQLLALGNDPAALDALMWL